MNTEEEFEFGFMEEAISSTPRKRVSTFLSNMVLRSNQILFQKMRISEFTPLRKRTGRNLKKPIHTEPQWEATLPESSLESSSNQYDLSLSLERAVNNQSLPTVTESVRAESANVSSSKYINRMHLILKSFKFM